MSKNLTLVLDGAQLALAVPADLEAKLLESASLSVAEMHRQLGGNAMAGTLAKALFPLVSSGLAVKRHDLASLIARDDPQRIRGELRAIYADVLGIKPKKGKKAPPPKPDEPELTVALYCERYMKGEGREDPEMLQFAVNNAEEIEAEFKRINEAALAAKEGGKSGKA